MWRNDKLDISIDLYRVSGYNRKLGCPNLDRTNNNSIFQKHEIISGLNVQHRCIKPNDDNDMNCSATQNAILTMERESIQTQTYQIVHVDDGKYTLNVYAQHTQYAVNLLIKHRVIEKFAENVSVSDRFVDDAWAGYENSLNSTKTRAAAKRKETLANKKAQSRRMEENMDVDDVNPLFGVVADDILDIQFFVDNRNY